jgi:hypothetical protein
MEGQGGAIVSKPLVGLILGSILGLLDGLSALFYPEAAPMIGQIVVGSTLKGLVTGLAMGFLARKLRSVPAGVLIGLALGLALSFLAAQAPNPDGKHHYVEIMLPGAILGLIVGFATQRFGRAVLLVFALLPGVARADAKPADPWADFKYFVGAWEGSGSGKPGNGSGQQVYELVLGGRFLHMRNAAVYPPQPKNPKGERHEDWSLMSYDRGRGKYVWRQFHGEGFVNQYVLERPDARTFVWTTESIENIPPGWRARETIRIVDENEFTQTFELAEPGKDFEVYAQGEMHRRPAARP